MPPLITNTKFMHMYDPGGCLSYSSRPRVGAARILVTREICSDAEPLPQRGRRKSSAAV